MKKTKGEAIRVNSGGSWCSYGGLRWLEFRFHDDPDEVSNHIGFRLVRRVCEKYSPDERTTLIPE